jgi:hypothetical protein
MAKKNGINFKFELEPRLLQYFQNTYPDKLREARRRSVEAAGAAWADEAKSITRAEDHIDTGLYVNSIGYATGTPANPLYELQEGADEARLTIGADVRYAEPLEKRYAIFARGLDVAEPRMRSVAETQIKNTLGL